uniref:GntR family transcriptional regulator n=1 Tax=Candidatus Scatomorpha intestinigallinarum TaxID=2840923 RepID=UPI004028722D
MIDFGAFRAEDGTPIYLQIIKYLKQGVVSGAVADGDELPSRRVLSALLGLNPNTVQKACRMLEEEGLLVSHAGAKSCVRVTPELRERVRAELIRSDAVAAASAFRRMGVPLEDAIELVKRAYEEAEE